MRPHGAERLTPCIAFGFCSDTPLKARARGDFAGVPARQGGGAMDRENDTLRRFVTAGLLPAGL